MDDLIEDLTGHRHLPGGLVRLVAERRPRGKGGPGTIDQGKGLRQVVAAVFGPCVPPGEEYADGQGRSNGQGPQQPHRTAPTGTGEFLPRGLRVERPLPIMAEDKGKMLFVKMIHTPSRRTTR